MSDQGSNELCLQHGKFHFYGRVEQMVHFQFICTPKLPFGGATGVSGPCMLLSTDKYPSIWVSKGPPVTSVQQA